MEDFSVANKKVERTAATIAFRLQDDEDGILLLLVAAVGSAVDLVVPAIVMEP